MEGNGESSPRPSPAEARASLDDVRRMEADLADRLVTPWWYYPGTGLVVALLIARMAFPDGLRTPALVIALASLVLLIRRYQRQTGLAMSNKYFALARGWSVALLVIVIVAIVVGLLVDKPVVTAATAALVFVATVVLGPRADTAMRKRLRDGTRAR